MKEVLRHRATEAASRARVPYSGRPEAAVLLLSDGCWVPGVRVESASFSLVIPALLNAFTTAVAAGRLDVVAVALSRALRAEDSAYLEAVPFGAFRRLEADLYVRGDVDVLPDVGERLALFLDAPRPGSPEAGIALAREVARRAHVPESRFPVGCVLETTDGRLLPGVNVEHSDWSRILCAERNALGTAVSYDVASFRHGYLSCPSDPAGTPCGACRQLLVELAPAMPLWMDRGGAPPERVTSEALLPGSFAGARLARHSEA